MNELKGEENARWQAVVEKGEAEVNKRGGKKIESAVGQIEQAKGVDGSGWDEEGQGERWFLMEGEHRNGNGWLKEGEKK